MAPGSSFEKKPGNPLPNLSMYEVPGHGPATEYDYQRYLRSKANYDEAIKELVEKQKVEDQETFDKYIRKIKSAPNDQRAALIRTGLASSNPDIQIASVYMIESAPEDQQAALIKIGLSSSNDVVQERTASHIPSAPEDLRVDLIKIGLSVSNPIVQLACSNKISCAPESEQAPLKRQVVNIIETGLTGPGSELQKYYAHMIADIPLGQRTKLIQLGLASPRLDVQKYTANTINCAPKDQHAQLRKIVAQIVESSLANPDPKSQERSASLLEFVQRDQRANLIKLGLTAADPKVQVAFARLIEYATDDQMAELVKIGLASNNPEVQGTSAIKIYYLSLNQQAPIREQVAQIVKSGLASADPKIQESSAYMISCTPEDQHAPLKEQVVQIVKSGIASSNPKIQQDSISLMEKVIPVHRQASLWEQAIKAGLGKYLIQPPLYKKHDVDNNKFSRAQFEKDGSELTLLGGGLKDKTVMRRITAKAFLAWQKVFEDSKLWQDHGFDYVPIEPIQSFVLNKDGTVSVYCGVLDMSLVSWSDVSSLFVDNLYKQKELIINILKEQHVVHGHTHLNNFCLKFYRDSEGNPDLTREPRIYLIDFDQAVS